MKDTPTPQLEKPVDMFEAAWPLLKGWADLLTKPLRNDQSLADSTFELWCRLMRELRRGPEGIEAVRAELNVALTLTFPHTTIYQRFYALITGVGTGELKPTKELQVLLDQAARESTTSRKRKRTERIQSRPEGKPRRKAARER